ncbi:MAG: murein biosynthesis integral membrane protein MurJ [Slackia sp.]
MNATHISTSEDESISPSEATAQTPTSVGSSAALISFFVIISRITGFMRTWAMAFALGSTMLASSYQVANNLPNMLYELVMGGMLVTAFLPVYMSVKAKLGDRGGNEYASNIMSIAFIVLGAVALVCTVFAPALIFTQSFMNDQSTMDDAVFFFRFFAIQIVFYGLSSIVSGLLNASRDYLWSSAAPIFNNIIVTATFVLYAFVAPHDSELAKLIIAVGNPLGVFVQMAIQLPALKRNGIKLRLRVDLRDPALKETLAIGVPAVLVMCAGLVVVSIQNAAAHGALDNGPSIIAYARLWFTLPYAFLTVPITTAMFTEISGCANGNMRGFRRGISGTNQIVFFMVPFALYLVVFAEPLVTLYHIGAFTEDNISQIALYLAALAFAAILWNQHVSQKCFRYAYHGPLCRDDGSLHSLPNRLHCGLRHGNRRAS